MVAAAKKNGEEGKEVERSSCTPMGPLSVCERRAIRSGGGDGGDGGGGVRRRRL
jgi:hypothetical protein